MRPKQSHIKNEVSDLHLHLNGSLSLAFLEKLARLHDRNDLIQQLVLARQAYAVKPEEIALGFKLFEWVHQIMSLGTLHECITEGTLDVISNSSAHYLEIRTTPKSSAAGDWLAYVAAFVDGLKIAREQFHDQKVAYGLLSIDRSQCRLEEAFKIIDRVAQEKLDSGLLLGIDISGNPLAPRTITGDSLKKVLEYAFSKDLGVAIHFGEADSDVEMQDNDCVLDILKHWEDAKVRLGHVIFTTSEQKNRIRRLQIPIEICPTCHQKLNWWKADESHPGTSIYQHWSDPLVSGTDDETIFGSNARDENETVLRAFHTHRWNNFLMCNAYSAHLLHF